MLRVTAIPRWWRVLVVLLVRGALAHKKNQWNEFQSAFASACGGSYINQVFPKRKSTVQGRAFVYNALGRIWPAGRGAITQACLVINALDTYVHVKDLNDTYLQRGLHALNATLKMSSVARKYAGWWDEFKKVASVAARFNYWHDVFSRWWPMMKASQGVGEIIAGEVAILQYASLGDEPKLDVEFPCRVGKAMVRTIYRIFTWFCQGSATC